MSIQRRLLLALMAVLLAGAALTGIIAYREAREEANVLFDYELKQVAQSFSTQVFPGLANGRPGLPGPEGGVVVQVWNLEGQRLYLSHPDARLPTAARLGFSDGRGPDGSDWRLYTAFYDNVVIEAAQPLSFRRELAAAVALRTAMPLLLVLPVLSLLTWVVVGAGLRPIRRLAAEMSARSASAMEPVELGVVPAELKPVADELNRLLARLDRTLAVQRDFIADAAHQLRTPLTALQLQVQLVEKAATPEERAAALTAVRAGLTRSAHLVEQLLALTRSEYDTEGATRIDLRPLVQGVIAAATPLALEKNLDLGLEEGDRVWVAGSVPALEALVANLVDNAVRYSPRGGRIDVAVALEGGRPVLTVTDSGPGIPADERARVFDRFYRGSAAEGPGTGLGLAIVRAVAERHGATVALSDRGDGLPGLVVTVRFPAPAP